MKNRFSTIVKVTLASLYLIFLAGSIVRMTGSGMGCPDWPKPKNVVGPHQHSKISGLQP